MRRRAQRHNGYTTSEIIVRGSAVAVALGCIGLAGAAINSDTTTADFGFGVECADPGDKATVLLVEQQDMFNYDRDHDTIQLGCGAEAKVPTSVELAPQPDGADILVTVQYHDGVLDSGAPVVSVEPGGIIGFRGDSTITNWEITSGK